MVQSLKTIKKQGLEFDFSAVIETIGLSGLLESIGVERITEDPAFKTAFQKVVKKKDVDWLLSKLSQEEVEELKKRLK